MRNVYLKVSEVADFYNVSVSTIRNWMREGLFAEDKHYCIISRSDKKRFIRFYADEIYTLETIKRK